MFLQLQSIQGHGGCGTSSPSTEQKEMLNNKMLDFIQSNPDIPNRLSSRDTSKMRFPINWHIISDGVEGHGYVNEWMIKHQINILNQWLLETNIEFYLQTMDYTVNASWWNITVFSNLEREMKSLLYIGNYRHLNIYSVTIFNWGGYSTFPDQNLTNFDGVLVSPSEMPTREQTTRPGTLLVHEVAHWLGLYHTFEGGCSYPGDYVNDTPAQLHNANNQCPGTADSCPNEPGLDPNTNMMDYGGDACRKEITPGQRERIKIQVLMYRNMEPINVTSIIPLTPTTTVNVVVTTIGVQIPLSSTTSSSSITSPIVTNNPVTVTTSSSSSSVTTVSSESITRYLPYSNTIVPIPIDITTSASSSASSASSSLSLSTSELNSDGGVGLTTKVIDITTSSLPSSSTQKISTTTSYDDSSTEPATHLPLSCDEDEDNCPIGSTCVNQRCVCNKDGSLVHSDTDCPIEFESGTSSKYSNIRFYLLIIILFLLK